MTAFNAYFLQNMCVSMLLLYSELCLCYPSSLIMIHVCNTEGNTHATHTRRHAHSHTRTLTHTYTHQIRNHNISKTTTETPADADFDYFENTTLLCMKILH